MTALQTNPPPTMAPLPEAVPEELLLHFSILTRAGHNYRTLLNLLADEFPEINEKLMHHRELVKWSDTVIDAWHEKLGQNKERLDRWVSGQALNVASGD